MVLLLYASDKNPGSPSNVNIEKEILKSSGEGLGVAVNLAKLNIPVSVITSFDNDNYGKIIFRDILKYSINLKGIEIINGNETGFKIYSIDKNKNETLIGSKDKESLITKELIYKNIDILESSKYVYLTGYYSNIGIKEYDKLITNLKKSDKFIFFNLSGFTKEDDLKELLNLLGNIDVFIVNHETAKIISGVESPDKIINFFKKNKVKEIFLILSEKGNLRFYNEKQEFHNKKSVEKVFSSGEQGLYYSGIAKIIYDIIKDIE